MVEVIKHLTSYEIEGFKGKKWKVSRVDGNSRIKMEITLFLVQIESSPACPAAAHVHPSLW